MESGCWTEGVFSSPWVGRRPMTPLWKFHGKCTSGPEGQFGRLMSGLKPRSLMGLNGPTKVVP